MFASCGSDELPSIKIGNLEVMTKDLGNMNWYDAVKACDDLGSGWRLPTLKELNLLYENKEMIGGFTSNWYWSSPNRNGDMLTEAEQSSLPISDEVFETAWVGTFSNNGVILTPELMNNGWATIREDADGGVYLDYGNGQMITDETIASVYIEQPLGRQDGDLIENVNRKGNINFVRLVRDL